MRRVFLALGLTLALSHPASAAPPPRVAATFDVRVEGKVLRKSSAKLVFSLSAFEVGADRYVSLQNRKSGALRKIPLSSVYEDMSYSEPLPEDQYDAYVPEEWIPFVVWHVDNSIDGLNERLTAIHEEQNNLRRQLGKALLEDEGEGAGKVSSRSTLNKIEKYHYIATILAREILKTWNKEETNPFLFPVRIQVAFNPFVKTATPGTGATSPVQQVREVMFWEMYRVLSQQYEVPDPLIDLAYNCPPTIRQIVPIGALTREDALDFAPTVFLSSETLDGVVYIDRQGFQAEVKDVLRTKQFLSTFVTDRPVLDALLNEGRVAGVDDRRLAVSFVPPFMKVGEKVWVVLSDEEEVAVTLDEPHMDEGYTHTSELPAQLLSRIRPGMTVRRKK